MSGSTSLKVTVAVAVSVSVLPSLSEAMARHRVRVIGAAEVAADVTVKEQL